VTIDPLAGLTWHGESEVRTAALVELPGSRAGEADSMQLENLP